MLEMPSGTGKTVSLLSLIVAYMKAHPGAVEKFVYCSRTVPELEKVMGEMKVLDQYYKKETGSNGCGLLAVALSSRKNLCIEPSVRKAGDGETTDANCRKLTASFVRRQRQDNPDVPGCSFYEKFDLCGREEILPTGVYSLVGFPLLSSNSSLLQKDLQIYGKNKGFCPYFLARHAVKLYFINFITEFSWFMRTSSSTATIT